MKKIIYLFFLTASFCSAQLQTSFRYLDKNKVRALIATENDKFWNMTGNATASYEVPVGKNTHAMYASSIWIGGFDPGGQLHLAANTYKQQGADFFPGPLDTTNITAFSNSNIAVYNRLWKIDCNEINSFVQAYNNGSAGTLSLTSDFLNYPGKGTANFQKNFAPFYDANNNGIYDPLAGGDYPIIRGHQQILSVFNDNYTSHSESHAAKMGIEVHERSYAYSDPLIHDTMQAINYTTFYLYTIYNRSNTNYHDVFISDWSDVDIGYQLNDNIGTDTVNNFIYCYNASSFDPNLSSGGGYGNKPPVVSHVLLPVDCSADGIDNNQNNAVDELGETFLMNRVTYFHHSTYNFPAQMSNPTVGSDFYNYMTGYWKDFTPFTYGGTAYGGTQPTPFVYTGNPQNGTGWIQGATSMPDDGGRMIMSSGPFSLPAGGKIEWGYAIVFSQDTTQPVNTINQLTTRVQRDVRNIKYYDAMHKTPQCTPAITNLVGIRQEKFRYNGMAYPNPAKDKITIDLGENVMSASITIMDLLGKEVIHSDLSNGHRKVLNVSGLDEGIYFIEVKESDKTQVLRFVKD
jgi:hypothetical protein